MPVEPEGSQSSFDQEEPGKNQAVSSDGDRLLLPATGVWMITVLVVDDHSYFRTSLRHMLEAADDIQVIATAVNGAEAIVQARKNCPGVAVMDISMPVMDGIEAARQIRADCPMTRVMMLSILDQPEYVQRALDVGALGFVLKDAIQQDLLAAIRAVARGKRYFSRKIAEIAAAYLDDQRPDRAGA
jgi:DNA-binding NarL/FixJ family response regulator